MKNIAHKPRKNQDMPNHCQTLEMNIFASETCIFLFQQVTIPYKNMFKSKKLTKNNQNIKIKHEVPIQKLST
jgi:hypothetical protein